MLTLIDKLLRGSFTQRESLKSGRIDVPVRSLVWTALAMGAFYGVFMGLYGVLRPEGASPMQIVASAVKVPLLFLLTLGVSFPSLYVFSALSNSSLDLKDTLRLILIAITINLIVLASLGPVTGFFTLSTDSYPFMKLLNVAFFAVGGFVGVAFLRKSLRAILNEVKQDAPSMVVNEIPAPGAIRREPPYLPAQPIPRQASRARTVLGVWTVIYAIVGAQMGWILRPFIGAPGLPFTWFRDRESNFFGSVLDALRRLIVE